MHYITLICTVHGESGICNINELYNIIEIINPEVIFEEIPPSAFDAYYKDKSRSNLETDTINMYLESHHIDHIPVDYFNIPDSFFKDHRYMHQRVVANSHEYRTLIDTHSLYVKQYGFKFLNSIHCINLNKEIYTAIEKSLQRINDAKLFKTYEMWNYVIKKREYEMINNIYGYCREYKFYRGLFFVGAAHRESIINLIQKHTEAEHIEINWNYSNYNDIL